MCQLVVWLLKILESGQNDKLGTVLMAGNYANIMTIIFSCYKYSVYMLAEPIHLKQLLYRMNH